MRLRFPLVALLVALVAVPAAAQQSSRTAPRPFVGPAVERGGDLGDPFTGVAVGSKEVPANGSTARGYAYGRFFPATNQLFVLVPTANLQGTFQGAHIHSGAPGTNGPVLYPAENVYEDGETVYVEFEVTLTPEQVALLQGGQLYVNVHTSAFPSGEVRAQLEGSDFLPDVREAGVGDTVTTLAYVARAKGAFTYLNDGLGGVAVRQTQGPFFEAVQSGAIRPGVIVRVTGTLSDFRGLLQIDGADLTSFEVANAFPDNVNALYTPATLAEIAADGEAFESVLVLVRDVLIDGGVGGGDFQPATTHTADDGSGPVTPVSLRVPVASDSEVPGRDVPNVPVTVLGVVGQFTTAVPATDGYQLVVIEDYDVAPTGLVQFIHNSADPALATVDVVADGDVVVDGLAFRSATGPTEVPAFTLQIFDVLDSSGVSVTAGVDEFIPGEAPRVFVLQGVVDPSLFAANPDTEGIVAQLSPIFVPPASGPAAVGVSVLHGATDAPTLDLRSGTSLLVDDLRYGYLDFTDVPAASEVLDVTTADGAASLGLFRADFSALGGQPVTVLTSGFLDPSANQNGPAFGLLAVTADGTATLLPRVDTAVGEGPEGAALSVRVGANPVRTRTEVRFTLSTAGPARVTVSDVLGREVAVLAEGEHPAGTHQVALDAARLAPGVYTVRLTSGALSTTARVTVVR